MKNRKKLYLILGIIVVSVFTLTVVYAALSVTLNITGNAEVNSADWGIEIDDDVFSVDIQNELLTTGYTTVGKNHYGYGDVEIVSTGTISGTTISGIDVSLTKPSDGLTILFDVINVGSIPMKLESIEQFEPSIVSSINSDADVEWYKNNVQFSSGMDSTVEGDVFCPGYTDQVGFLIVISEDATTIPSGELIISNLGARLHFVQADSSECS